MPDLVTDGDNLGDHLATRSFKTIKGSDIASSTNITIGTSGNTFDVTGTTTIQHFDNANWAVGSVVSLHFDGALILTNNAGSLSGAKCNILLTGDTNYTTKAGDIITFLLHESTSWQEISRNSSASIDDNSISNAKLMAGIDAVKIGDGSVSNAEFQHLDGVNGDIQPELDAKAGITGGNTIVTVGTITSGAWQGTAIASNYINTGLDALKLADGTVTNTEFKYINTLSSNAQDQLNLKSPIANPTFTGTVVAGIITSSGTFTSNGNIQMGTGAKITSIKNLQHEVSTSGTDIDFSETQLQTMSIASNTTFTTTNRAVGLSKTIRLITDGTVRTLTFPTDWKFIGVKPTEQAASKTGILTVTNFGTTDAYIVAAYAVQE